MQFLLANSLSFLWLFKTLKELSSFLFLPSKECKHCVKFPSIVGWVSVDLSFWANHEISSELLFAGINPESL